MSQLANLILEIYLKLGGQILLGFILGYILPKSVPNKLGKFLLWIGIPISIFVFLRKADLSGVILISPVFAWLAMLLAGFLSNIYINIPGAKEKTNLYNKQTQGSFYILTMFGNTSYLGFPLALTLLGEKYFAWAVFYQLMNVVGLYGLGIAIASNHSTEKKQELSSAIIATIKSPTLWSFIFGLIFHGVPISTFAEQDLQYTAWTMVSLGLVLIGMRIAQVKYWGSLKPAFISLSIKMILVPLILSFLLLRWGFNGLPLLAITLQMGMPPAFSALVLAENYNLDRALTITTVLIGSLVLLFTLPIWLWLFGITNR